MRQEQERFRQQFSSSDRGVDTNPPRRWSASWRTIDNSISPHPIEAVRQERFRDVSFNTNQEDNNGERGEEGSRKGSDQKPDGFEPAQRGFEPFLNQEFKEEDLFVNNYGGNYAQKIELNRRRVERALQIAHLNGKVFLTNLQQSRSRAEAQGDELAAKRFLIFGERTQKLEEENPYKRVVSIPEGWRIEINDQRITEELTERKLSGEILQKAFINRFNIQLKDALIECVWREKCSSEKDPHFRYKLFWSVTHAASPYVGGVPWLISNSFLMFACVPLGVTLLVYGTQNIISEQRNRSFRNIEDILKDINSNFKTGSFSRHRKIDHSWEYFMPDVEIDKVARTFAYLTGKGRRLVRETKDR